MLWQKASGGSSVVEIEEECMRLSLNLLASAYKLIIPIFNSLTSLNEKFFYSRETFSFLILNKPITEGI